MSTCEFVTRIERFVGDTSPVIGTLYVEGELLIPTGNVYMKVFAPDTTNFLDTPLFTIQGTVDANGKVSFSMDQVSALTAEAYPYRIIVDDTYTTTFVSDVIILK